MNIDFTKIINDGLNTNTFGRVFKLYAEYGELEREVKEHSLSTGIIPGVVNTVQGSPILVKNYELVSVNANIDIFCEFDKATEDGSSTELEQILQIIKTYITAKNGTNSAIVVDEKPYNTSFQFGQPVVQEGQTMTALGNRLVITMPCLFVVVENGVSSTAAEVVVCGENMAYTKLGMSSIKVVEAVPFEGENSVKNAVEQSGITVALDVPVFDTFVGNMLLQEAIKPEPNKALPVELNFNLTGKKISQNYIMAMTKNNLAMSGIQNIGASIELGELNQDVADFSDWSIVEKKVMETLSVLETGGASWQIQCINKVIDDNEKERIFVGGYYDTGSFVPFVYEYIKESGEIEIIENFQEGTTGRVRGFVMNKATLFSNQMIVLMDEGFVFLNLDDNTFSEKLSYGEGIGFYRGFLDNGNNFLFWDSNNNITFVQKGNTVIFLNSFQLSATGNVLYSFIKNEDLLYIATSDNKLAVFNIENYDVEHITCPTTGLPTGFYIENNKLFIGSTTGQAVWYDLTTETFGDVFSNANVTTFYGLTKLNNVFVSLKISNVLGEQNKLHKFNINEEEIEFIKDEIITNVAAPFPSFTGFLKIQIDNVESDIFLLGIQSEFFEFCESQEITVLFEEEKSYIIIFWGDGSSSSATDVSTISHTYEPGTYKIHIYKRD